MRSFFSTLSEENKFLEQFCKSLSFIGSYIGKHLVNIATGQDVFYDGWVFILIH